MKNQYLGITFLDTLHHPVSIATIKYKEALFFFPPQPFTNFSSMKKRVLHQRLGTCLLHNVFIMNEEKRCSTDNFFNWFVPSKVEGLP